MPISQDNRNLAINTNLGEDKVLIKSATITEQLGRLFQMDVDLVSEDDDISFNDVIGYNATIRLELIAKGETRYFNGFVSRFVHTGVEGHRSEYRATLVPWLWFLTRTADCRIFQTMTIPDIVKQVFRDRGFTDFRDALTGNYTQWEYCVQYRETDFNFVSRLMEHEGIYYFFEHEDGKHTLVLADSASAHKSYPGYDDIDYQSDASGIRDAEYVSSMVMEQELQPGSYVLNDFNFEKPKSSLLAKTQNPLQHGQANFEMYDYPGEYTVQSDGNDYSKIRIEELHAGYEVFHGQANARGIATGCTFTLKPIVAQTLREDEARKYLITSSSFHLLADDYGSSSSHGGQLFSCSFTAIDAQRQYRSPRITPKPLIQGPQTAIVVGPKGDEIYTDQYGRVKLQFHWDRYGKADENSSCWIRLSQAGWAGKKWGALHIPRIGQEVIVEHLEGDPDLPIITGRVFNGDCMPPYDLPAEKTKTTLKSNSSKGGQGFNEIRFEDKKGEEQIFIHGEKNEDVRIKNNAYEWIGNDRHLIVVHDQIEHVENNRNETVDANHMEKIGQDRHLTVTGKEAVQISGSKSLTVSGDVIEVFQGNHSEQTTNNCYVKAMNVIIEGMQNVTIKVGGTSIALGPDGVAITGPQIQIQGSAMVQVQGGMVKIN